MKPLIFIIGVCALLLTGCGGTTDASSSASTTELFLRASSPRIEVLGQTYGTLEVKPLILEHSPGTIKVSISNDFFSIQQSEISPSETSIALTLKSSYRTFDAVIPLAVELTGANMERASLSIPIKLRVIHGVSSTLSSIEPIVVKGIPVSILNQRPALGITTSARVGMFGETPWLVVDHSPELILDNFGPSNDIGVKLADSYIQTEDRKEFHITFRDQLFGVVKTQIIVVNAVDNAVRAVLDNNIIEVNKSTGLADLRQYSAKLKISYPFDDLLAKSSLNWHIRGDETIKLSLSQGSTLDNSEVLVTIDPEKLHLIRNDYCFDFNIDSRVDLWPETFCLELNTDLLAIDKIYFNNVPENEIETVFLQIDGKNVADTTPVYIGDEQYLAVKKDGGAYHEVRFKTPSPGIYEVRFAPNQRFGAKQLNVYAAEQYISGVFKIGQSPHRLIWNEKEKIIYIYDRETKSISTYDGLNQWNKNDCTGAGNIVDIQASQFEVLALNADRFYTVTTDNHLCLLSDKDLAFEKRGWASGRGVWDSSYYPYTDLFYNSDNSFPFSLVASRGPWAEPIEEKSTGHFYSEAISWTRPYSISYGGVPLIALFENPAQIVSGSRTKVVDGNQFSRFFLPALSADARGEFDFFGDKFVANTGAIYKEMERNQYKKMGAIPAGKNFLSADGSTAYRFNITASRVWLGVFDLNAAPDAQGNWSQTGTIELALPLNPTFRLDEEPLFEVPQNNRVLFIAQSGYLWVVTL